MNGAWPVPVWVVCSGRGGAGSWVALLILFPQSSESVTLDLLTYTDLESLRNRKMGGRPGSLASRSAQLNSKRYLILIYSVEFDRWVQARELVGRWEKMRIELQNPWYPGLGGMLPCLCSLQC